VFVLAGLLAAGVPEVEARANLQLPWPSTASHNIAYGNSYGCGYHTGSQWYAIDFNLYYEAVSSVSSGQAALGYSESLGFYVSVAHGAGFTSTYGHLDSYSVSSGAWIRPGQQIAVSGNSGTHTTGAHLHFWITKDGSAYKPEPMSSQSGFDNYGYVRIGDSCTFKGTSPNWYGTPSRSDVSAFYAQDANRGLLHSFLSSGSSLVFQSPNWWDSGAGAYTLSLVGGRMVTCDLTGDGRRDIATFYGSGSSATIHAWESTGTSFTFKLGMTWTSNSYSLSQVGDRIVCGDFNGDGFDDIAVFFQYSPGAVIHVWTSNGSALSYKGDAGWGGGSDYTLSRVVGRMVAGDFNRDGKVDIATFYDYVGSSPQIHVWISTGSSFAWSDSWKRTETGYTVSQAGDRFVSGDFNGDGRFDLATFYQDDTTARLHVWTSTGSAFNARSAWTSISNYALSQVAGRMVAADFNGGGYDDVATFRSTATDSSQINVWTSTGLGFNPMAIWFTSTSYTLGVVGDRMVAGDFDDK
jgi:hypothetical protein